MLFRSAQVGFYLGRVGELGLNKDEVVSGLQAWTQEVFGLDRPPIIPHGAQMRLGLGGGNNNGRSFNRSSWEGRGSRFSNSSKPWSSGNRSDASYGQRRPGGYGSTSYGSRDWNNNYSPRTSQYGSGDRWSTGRSNRQSTRGNSRDVSASTYDDFF